MDPTVAEFRFHLGRARQALDELPAAQADYLEALRIDETLDGAWRGLGETSQVLRNFDAAARAWRHALNVSPDDVRAWNNLGLAELHRGDVEASTNALRQALKLDPGFVLAWSNLLRAQDQLGDIEAMAVTADKLIEISPDRPTSHLQRASVLQRQNRLDEAVAAVGRAIELDPDNADAHYALGVLQAIRGEHAAATRAYERAGKLCPGNPLPDAHRAMSLLASGDPLGAVRELRELDRKFPDQFDVKVQLAEALGRSNQGQEAVASARQAVAIRPNDSTALSLLGRLLGNVGEQTEAEQHFRRALQCKPWPPAAAANLASMLALRGQLAEGLALHRELVGRFPKTVVARSNFLLHLNGDPETPPAEIAAEHAEWGRLHAPVRAVTHDNDRDPDRPLRVGYVSPDFREHSVAFFIEPIIAHHDRKRVKVICYDNVALPDRMTEHLRSFSDEWYRIVGRSDVAIAEQIRNDRIDILVDLAGHTGDHRLGLFALKPAPVQVSYLGYPNTTGVPQIDFRVTDDIADPPGMTDAWHAETLVRLAPPFLVYRPPMDAPPVAPLPAGQRGPVTFGSFNALSKLNRTVFDAWAATLRAVPGSMLLLKANGLGDAQTRGRISDAFAGRGVARERLQFAPRTRTYLDHVNTYARVDVALDTFPYNGTTTTCEALYMGVPVVTPAGTAHVGRVGMSLLTSVGLGEFIAPSVEDFAAVAVKTVADLMKLAAVRSSLRRRMAASPLMDGRGFVRKLEAAYRTMWHTYTRLPDASNNTIN
ncbi:MAG TPA: tetratricopeptide repeat protein [Tepidisphaeraceae bacterium]